MPPLSHQYCCTPNTSDSLATFHWTWPTENPCTKVPALISTFHQLQFSKENLHFVTGWLPQRRPVVSHLLNIPRGLSATAHLLHSPRPSKSWGHSTSHAPSRGNNMDISLPLSLYFLSFYFIVGMDCSTWSVTRSGLILAFLFLNIPAEILIRFLLRIQSFFLYISALYLFSFSSIFGHCVKLIIIFLLYIFVCNSTNFLPPP